VRKNTRLMGKFHVKAFNDTVVLGGNVPLDVLGRNVDEYIRTTRSWLFELERVSGHQFTAWSAP
jgi:hypothetical protein